MKCHACDKILSDYETSLRSATTDTYMDMCLGCIDTVDLNVWGNMDIKHNYDDLSGGDNIGGMLYSDISIDDH